MSYISTGDPRCHDCHFDYEEREAFPHLPPVARAQLATEHAALRRGGFPREGIRAHIAREMPLYRRHVPMRVVQSIEADHAALGVFEGPQPPALALRAPVVFPRADAIAIATLERDSLWLRAAEGGACAEDWRRAAQAANEVVRYLRTGEDLAAVSHMYRVADGWKRAASCRQYPVPTADVELGGTALLLAGLGLAWWLLR